MFTFQRCSGKETAPGVAVLISLNIVFNTSLDKKLVFQQQGRNTKQTKVVIHRKHSREANDSPPANNKAGSRYRQMGSLGANGKDSAYQVHETENRSGKDASDGLLESSARFLPLQVCFFTCTKKSPHGNMLRSSAQGGKSSMKTPCRSLLEQVRVCLRGGNTKNVFKKHANQPQSDAFPMNFIIPYHRALN